MKKALLLLPFTVMLSACQTAPRPEVGAWFTLFDGETLDGWRASENPDSVRIEDGVIVCNGDRSHVFYVGPDGNASFKNFEFEAEVMTTPGSNSGIYFHTEYQETGWSSKGYEAQVFNSHTKADGSVSGERKMTGSVVSEFVLREAIVADEIICLVQTLFTPFGNGSVISKWCAESGRQCGVIHSHQIMLAM